MMYVDLHIHTQYSDGIVEPRQIARNARIRSLDMIAITDHDSIKGYRKALPEARRLSVTLMPGVELSTLEHHLVGLNFDPDNKRFLKFLDHSLEIQRGVTQQRIDILAEAGVPITYKKVQMHFPDYPIGKAVTMMAMLFDGECRECFMRKHGDLDMRRLFGIYLSSNGVAGKVEMKEGIVWDEASYEVRAAGGYPVFAHPPTKSDDPAKVESMLRAVDAIEVQPKYGERNLPFIRYAQENGLFITYGSDYHNPDMQSEMLARGENQIDEKLFGAIKGYRL